MLFPYLFFASLMIEVVLVKHACCLTGQYKDIMHAGKTPMSPLVSKYSYFILYYL